jgi:hypothetical protein
VFKNLFNKKNKSDYDPLNLRVSDLAEGFIFEYDLKQWEVLIESTYDWGDNYFSKEYKITDGKETLFLAVEEDDELEVAIYRKIKISQIDVDIEGEVLKNGLPPSSLSFDNKLYKREKESPGYYNPEKSSKEWVEFINWQYYDESGENSISIEQWGEREFEASIGKVIKPFEISNILPRE